MHPIQTLIKVKSPKLSLSSDNQQHNRNPIYLVLVIDVSGSMYEKNKLTFAIEGAKVAINMLEEKDKIGIVTFDSNVTILCELKSCSANNKLNLIRTVDSLQAGSSTNMIGGLSDGIKLCKKGNKDWTRRVILLSDGIPDSISGLQNIASSERNNGITVSTIGLGLDFNEQLMQSIAEHGGGNYYYASMSAQLPTIFNSELLLAKDLFTEKTTAIFLYNKNIVQNIKIIGYKTEIVKKDDFPSLKQEMDEIENGKKGNLCCMLIRMSDLIVDEERTILIRMNVNAKTFSKEFNKKVLPFDMNFGRFALQYKRLNKPEDEKIVIGMSLTIADEEETRNQVNLQDEAGRTRVMMLVDEDSLNEAHDQAMEEMRHGRIDAAQQILKNKQQDVQTKQKSYFKQKNQALVMKEKEQEKKKLKLDFFSSSLSHDLDDNDYFDNSFEACQDADDGILLMEQQNLRFEQSLAQIEDAKHNYNLQSDMIKQSKNYSYQSAQGQRSAIKQACFQQPFLQQQIPQDQSFYQQQIPQKKQSFIQRLFSSKQSLKK
jgi:hypothetical protein